MPDTATGTQEARNPRAKGRLPSLGVELAPILSSEVEVRM